MIACHSRTLAWRSLYHMASAFCSASNVVLPPAPPAARATEPENQWQALIVPCTWQLTDGQDGTHTAQLTLLRFCRRIHLLKHAPRQAGVRLCDCISDVYSAASTTMPGCRVHVPFSRPR